MSEVEHKGWYRRANLPHFDAAGVMQAITYHLADSLPADAVEQVQMKLAGLPEDQRNERMREWVHQYLDSGYGCCVLRKPAAARCVADTFVRFDRTKYDLVAWVVMPNHVHVLIRPYPIQLLPSIVQSWKSYTGRQIRRMFPTEAKGLWFADYWDRYIRDAEHLSRAIQYIHDNPVKAGLVRSAEQWPWSSWTYRQG